MKLSRKILGFVAAGLTAWMAAGCVGVGGSLVPPPVILVVDSGNDRLCKTPSMTSPNFTAVFGSSGSGVGQFLSPRGLAADRQRRIYIVDTGNHRIVRIDDTTGAGWVSFGSFGSGTNQFDSPTAVAVDGAGRIYVTDSGNDRIVRFDDMTGAGWTTYGSSGAGEDQFDDPRGIDILPSGRFVVVDAGNSRIVRFDDFAGEDWVEFGTAGSGEDQFSGPIGVNHDNVGRILVCDAGNNRLVRIDDIDGGGWTTLATGSVNPAFVDVDSTSRIYYTEEEAGGLLHRVNSMGGSGLTTFGTAGSGDPQFDGTAGVIVRL